jgi:hypothetical protein
MRKIHLNKFSDKPNVKKAYLIYVDVNKICDGCDTYNVRCASISSLSGDVLILCQDCIEGILESLDPSLIRDNKIKKILDV